MKGIILAAGYATRLYPLTENQPKALLPVGGKPIINYILSELETIPEIDEVIVVTNHKFATHFEKWAKEQKTPLKLTVIDDNTTDDTNKLGAVGDISYVIDTLKIDDEILVMAGDNIFTFKLKDYYDYYKKVDSDCILVKELERDEDLIRMAKDLGKEIQASEAYIRLAAAKTANDEDEALQEMIGKFNLKRIEINTLISQESIDNEKVSKLDAEVKELYKSIMTNKNMVAFNDAKNEMDSLMEKVNNILVAAINGMDPETADQVSSCGGSCSTCGGCH